MRFQQVTGPPTVVQCSGCQLERTAGTLGELTASGRLVDVVYQDTDATEPVFYCEQCAARHAEAEDTTRSRTQFYQDTSGEVIA